MGLYLPVQGSLIRTTANDRTSKINPTLLEQIARSNQI
jgi:hypothetical protein